MITSSKPRVSVVVPFFNTPPEFFKEAIESVLSQSFEDWELLLVDDGSIVQCSEIAQHYASKYPMQIRCLEHEGHQNRGQSASRNLGIAHSKGEYIAFLDSDDLWLPEKLETQVGILESQPEAAALYGNTQYWYSWTGRPRDHKRDYSPDLGVRADTLFRPPTLLPLFLRGYAAVPPPSSVIVRRMAVQSVGGFEDRYTDAHEDQVFYAKLCLRVPVYVSIQIWDRYRQHDDSVCAVDVKLKRRRPSRLMYLSWLSNYISEHHLKSPDVIAAIHKELWIFSAGRPNESPAAEEVLRRTKKWLVRLEEAFLPHRLSRWL